MKQVRQTPAKQLDHAGDPEESMDKYLPNFKNCLQQEPAFCVSACPFHLDVADFVEKIGRGAMDAAYKTYRNAVGFPEIVSALCPQPCKAVCPLDDSIELLGLEKACVQYAVKKDPHDYNLPMKHANVAIVGFGISGMGCLLRLATKKYKVTVFEKSGKPGGILWDLMDPNIFLQDLETQLQHETYTVHYNHPITDLDELSGFDAVYIATGKGGETFGMDVPIGESSKPESAGTNCKMMGSSGLFIGGTVLWKAPMDALADGLQMGTTIDNFLKTKHLNYMPSQAATKMVLDPERLENQIPAAGLPDDGFNREQAAAEANRCIRCQCDACRLHCDLTEYYNRWPLRIRDEIQATTLPGTSEVKATPAKRLISTCTQCGLCLETCPEDIDLGGLILAARKNMHKQGKLPWAFHEFWIRDMEFTNGNKAALVKKPPVGEATLAFFPGCQLGASDPALVEESYKYLLAHEPGSGLILSCCGIPASWGGDVKKADKAVAQIRKAWEALGRPTVVLACPTCLKVFREELPEVPCVFLYDLMAQWGVHAASAGRPSAMSIFDPCSTHPDDQVRKSVRQVASEIGIPTEPLPKQERYAACCSYGGQGSIANPDFAKRVVEKRSGESPYPYLAYCINCRDAFREGGKPAYHLLDLVFNREPTTPTISQRRENRIFLKEHLLETIWGDRTDQSKKEATPKKTLIMSDQLRQKLSKDRILEEDMLAVIDFCERTGRKVLDPETRRSSGYHMIGHGTYWVEYAKRTPEDGVAKGTKGTVQAEYELFNGYCHRIEIELEGVWNGKKVEVDL
jgi:Fe-S oxidoreductase